jgi:PAS domain S-box-containing protein
MEPVALFLAEDVADEAAPGSAQPLSSQAVEKSFLWTAEIAAGTCQNLSCSPSVEQSTGFEPEAFATPEALTWPDGKWFQLVHPDDREHYYSTWKNLLNQGELYVEHRIVTASGEVRRVISRATPLGGGRVAGVVLDLAGQARGELEESGHAYAHGDSVAQGYTAPLAHTTRQQDITDRRRMEEALRQSERDFRGLFENAHDAIIILAPEGETVLEVNQRACDMYGLSREEFVGSSMETVSKDALSGKIQIRETLGNKSSYHYETVQYRKDGTEMYLEINSSAVVYKGRIAILSINRDVTLRKLAERALRESEERFSKAFNSSPNPMAIATLPGWRFMIVNDRFGSSTGYSRDELIGRTAAELKLWLRPDDSANMVRMVQEKRGINGLEVFIRMKSGNVRIALLFAEIVELAGYQCLLLSAYDITERKRAEEEQAKLQAALGKAASEWQLTFDAVESPIMLLDTNGRITRLNEAARRLAEKSDEETVGSPVQRVHTGQPWQKAFELVQLARDRRGSASGQASDGDGDKTWDLTASIFSGLGDDRKVIVVARDITGIVKLQESLRRSETMSAMGALVAGVAHEVRNPLFSISATLDAFEARFGAREEHRKYVSVFRKELDRLNNLMQELLDYGRPNLPELSLASVEDCIAEAINSCAPLAEHANVEVTQEASAGLPAVMIDRSRIIQVLLNLIENGIQHSKPGGVVAVKAEEVDCDDERWISCSVRDSGPGFPEADLPRLFEPFFTRRRGGTGLGLSIVQRIVEEHGGRIFASNRPEGGALMEVRLAIRERE